MENYIIHINHPNFRTNFWKKYQRGIKCLSYKVINKMYSFEENWMIAIVGKFSEEIKNKSEKLL